MGHVTSTSIRFFYLLVCFSSLLAAAALWVARRVPLLWGPGSGLQLPLVRGFLPGTGSKPGQQGFPLVADFLVTVFFEADLVALFF